MTIRPFVIIVLLAALANGAFADRDIVFAAQYYRWSGEFYKESYSGGKSETLTNVGASHLYNINPDGTRRTQLTRGKWDDTGPVWSPNGKRILFARSLGEQWHSLCIIGSNGGSVRTIRNSKFDFAHMSHYSWSPGGQFVAAYVKGPSNGGQLYNCIEIINVKTLKRRTFQYGSQYAFSHDGQRLFICFATQMHRKPRCEIVNLLTNSRQKLHSGVWHPVWLNDHEIFGDQSEGYWDNEGATVKWISNTGKAQPITAKMVSVNGGDWRR